MKLILKSYLQILSSAALVYYLQSQGLPVLYNVFTIFFFLTRKAQSDAAWRVSSYVFVVPPSGFYHPPCAYFPGQRWENQENEDSRYFPSIYYNFCNADINLLAKLCTYNHRHWEEMPWEKIMLIAKKNICGFPELIFLTVQKFNTFI